MTWTEFKILKDLTLNRNRLTEKKKKHFLKALASGQSVTGACDEIFLTRQALYTQRDKDPGFKQQWKQAVEMGTDKLEDTAYERAIDQSDTLMKFLLKGRRPEKYADKSFIGRMDSEGKPIDFDDTERAVRMVNLLSEVLENADKNPDLVKKVKALQISMSDDKKEG
jgi:hypothetical protein